MRIELISFELCPFVQRSVIMLIEKHVDYQVRYIDLSAPPKWFLDISPFGKVPVLVVDDNVIFESAIINEYIDETTPPELMPKNPLAKAQNRAWIEFASNMLLLQYQWSQAANQTIFDDAESRMIVLMNHFESQLGNTRYFSGEDLNLVDIALAPLFLRFEVLFSHLPNEIFGEHTKTLTLSNNILTKDSVLSSKPEDFSSKYMANIRKNSPFMVEMLKTEKKQ